MDISVSLGVNIICGEIFAWEFLAHELKALVRAQFKEMYDENRHWIDPNFSICRFISDLLRYEDFSQQFGDVVRVVMESLFRHDGWTMTDPTFPMSNIINVLNLASSRRYRSGMIYQWTIFFRYNKRIYTEFQWRIQSKARFPRLPPEILEFVVNFVGASEWDARKTKTLASLCLTCRAFYNQSCPYLYRNIRLEKPNDLLLKTLSQWSHLRGLTNTVKIHSKKTKTYHEFFVYSQHLFPDLQSLSIHGLRLLHPKFVTICQPFSSVTKLSILNFCEFSSVLDLRRFIGGLFPNLSHLTLHDPEILSSYVTLPNRAPRKSSSLSHVTFKTEGDNDTLYPVRQWLKLTSTTNLLHYVSIDSKYLGDMILPFHRHLRVIAIHWTSDGFELHKRCEYSMSPDW
ncbi:hypothetical protein C8Q75DRAFT_250925 [Abortiporus biennis]|nr:hypothetical protein C8Q75DRAFT_250925 [Abortiporus biennis]